MKGNRVKSTAIELLQMDEEVLVDSRIVAKGIEVEHESFMKTIYTYQSELEEFGILRFEIGEIKGRGQPEKHAMLNRNQAGVAISFSRNTKQVVRFKVDLFKAIDTMEEHIHSLHKQIALTKERIDALIDPILDLTIGHGLGDVDYEIASILLHRLTRIASDLETITKKAPKNLKQQDVGKAISLLLDVKKYLSQLRHHVKVETAVHDLLLEIETDGDRHQARRLISEGILIEGPGNTKEEED